jgi:dTDP-L-rhamnose 4-epimerase
MSDRILITGGAGFIGSFLTDSFLARGDEVRILDSLDPQVHPGGRPAWCGRDAELVVADVRDKRAVAAALEGIDVVVHCAAAVGVGQALYRIRHYVDTNVTGTATLLEAMVEHSTPFKKLLVPTSMTSYGEGVYRRPSDGALLRPDVRAEEDVRRFGWEPVDPATGERLEAVPTAEDAELRARSVYALTKRYQEELALGLGRVYDIPVVCLRLFNVFGPRQALSNPYTGVLAIFLSRLLSGRGLVIYEDGLQTRDFVSVHDVVAAFAAAMAADEVRNEVLNVGTGVPRTITGIARDVADFLGAPLRLEGASGQFRVGDVRHCFADVARARRLLDFTPRREFRDCLAEIVAWSETAATADASLDPDAELRSRGLVR